MICDIAYRRIFVIEQLDEVAAPSNRRPRSCAPRSSPCSTPSARARRLRRAPRRAPRPRPCAAPSSATAAAAPPALERRRRPAERAIEMTQVARVRPPGRERVLHARHAHLMAAHRAQKTIRGVRHMAVVTRRSRRAGGVVRVRRDVCADGGVALRAGRVAVAIVRELPAVGIAVVHRVAREAGHRAVLMARRFERARCTRARTRAPCRRTSSGWARTRRRRRSVAHRRSCRASPAARSASTSASGCPGRKRIPDCSQLVGRTGDAVTLAAHLGGARRRQARRIHDRRIDAVAVVQRDAAERAAVGGDVLRRRPVARLAGDAELGGGARRHAGARVEAAAARA